MKHHHHGLLFAILSPLASSMATVFRSGAIKALGPLPERSIGGLLGSAILFFLIKIRKDSISLQKVKNNIKDLSYIVIFRHILGEVLFTFGLSQTLVIKAIFFTKVEPYFVLILSWFFLKEVVQIKHVFLLIIHLFGALLLSTGGELKTISTLQIGDLLILTAMLFFALTYAPGKRLSHNMGALQSNAIAMGIGGLVILPFMLYFSPLTKLANLSLGWLYLLMYVLLFNVIALTFWFAALKTVRGWIVSALRFVGPIFGAPVAYFLFGETLNFLQVLGAGIILITSFLIAREYLKTPEVST